MATVIIISAFMGFGMGIWNGNLFSIGMFTITLVLLLPFYSWCYLLLDTERKNMKVTAIKCVLTTLASIVDFCNLYIISQYI